MHTPLPAQIEHWLKLAINKKSQADARAVAVLHLTRIRDTIDDTLNNRKVQNEDMSFRRHTFRSERRL